MKITLPRLRADVAAIGGSIDEHSLKHDAIVVDAPDGRVWAASLSHAMRANFGGITGIKMSEAVADIASRVVLGTEPCDTDDCDVCAERAEDK